jgi:hypothetical protein
MTVTEDATISANYTGNGVLDTYAYTWKIYSNDQLNVYVIPDDAPDGYDPATYLKSLTSDYTVTGVGEDAGGNVVFETADIPIADSEVIILLNPPYEQATDYQPAGAFPAKAHEDALDKILWLILHMKRRLDGFISLADTVHDDPDMSG